jgi:nucleotide-binding universal stress UspA family protein
MWDGDVLPSAIKKFSIHPYPAGITAFIEGTGGGSPGLRGCHPEGPPPVRAVKIDHSLNRVSAKKVILAYDGSRSSENALDLALSVTRSFKARLHIVGIASLLPASSATNLQTIIERARKRFSKKFYEIRLNAMNEGLQVETMLTLGDPVVLILGNAERFHAGLIILGCPGFSARLSLEPTALLKEVSARTARPVLVVTAVKRMKKSVVTTNEVTE